MSESTHYTIPQEPGKSGALLLALVVHLALLAFLWIGVSWQSQEHGGVEAEVWDMQYREAAPKAPAEPEPVQQEKTTPQPEPKTKTVVKPEVKQEVKPQVAKADIALQQEKKRKEAKQKAEEEKRQKLEDDKRKKVDAAKKKKDTEDKRKQDLADKKARDKARSDEMRRIAGATGTGGSGTAPRSTGNNRGVDNSYGDKIRPKIRSNTAFFVPNSLDGNPAVEYAIELLPDGTLRTTPRKLKSSGVPGFDDAVLNAIKKSQPFPPDRSGKVPNSFILSHQPKAQ